MAMRALAYNGRSMCSELVNWKGDFSLLFMFCFFLLMYILHYYFPVRVLLKFYKDELKVEHMHKSKGCSYQ